MDISEFDFELPDELIAYEPLAERDQSRLLMIGDELQDKIFSELPSLINDNDLLVFNNSKVIPARIFAFKGEREFEVLLHRRKSQNLWTAFIKGSKKLKIGDELTCQNLLITIQNKSLDGEIEIALSDESLIEEYGHMPLPPYIKREDNEADKETYQTVYANSEKKGSVAAPTAGLHFTDALLEKIPNKAFVTLHVGAGTFQPVKTDNIHEHKMHAEWYEITQEVEDKILETKQNGGRVIAVGTTSCRVLESSVGKAGSGDTDIFIYPGYEFKVVDVLVTNFHLPKSTLFMLVSALAGTEMMQKAYAHAIEQKYRFFSYGDACLIQNSNSKS